MLFSFINLNGWALNFLGELFISHVFENRGSRDDAFLLEK